MRTHLIAATLAAAMHASQAGAAPLPGVNLDASTAATLSAAPAVSPPRTQYVEPSGAPTYTNRLVLERSPYLRQHAHNPVNWYPWGPEALAEAKRRGVPIFLSVGYATCHWCHVMEEESFDNAEVAALLNPNFVPVKVDRETLPDIDAQYMIATQILTGRGGWPNNLFLLPDGQPIVATSYQPRDLFAQTLTTMSADWQDTGGRQAMTEQAASVSEFVRLIAGSRSAAQDITDATYTKATEGLLADHDDFSGGFGEGPKFPNEAMLRFLLDRYERNGDKQAAAAALLTLRQIAAGGIHDHVGGGFHRYTVDQNWRTPHFEKMLYNQALLGANFLQAYRLTNDPVFERAARRALNYVLREMTAPGGAFFAAQDAVSPVQPGGKDEEGAYYVWTYDQLDAALGGEAEAVRASLGLDQQATIPAGAVAHVSPDRVPDFASLDPMLDRMRTAREARPAPLTDTKIIAGWNGLMIRTLVDGAETLGDPRYLDAAKRATAFITGQMLRGGDLARAWANGPLEAGTLRDYAWMGLALVALADATGEAQYLASAQRMSDEIIARFSDGPSAPLRLSQTPGPLGATYDVLEGATPTGNAASLELFALLSRRGEDAQAVENIQRADQLLAALSGSIVEAPDANISSVTATQVYRDGETGMTRKLGGGTATARLSVAGDRLSLALDFAPGWHANAHRPNNPDLIPTELAGLGLETVSYPDPKLLKLGFQSEPVAVLEDRSEITAQVTPGTEAAELTIQICGTDRCLPPEQHIFRLPAAM